MTQFKFRYTLLLLVVALGSKLAVSDVLARKQCSTSPLVLQVLGSGGPEMSGGRASTGYLIWQNGKARVLIDIGGGSALRFEQSGARIEDLVAIVFTHLHVDHSADFPALIKASYFSPRTIQLPVFGPSANELLPSMTGFTWALFGQQGAWPYLNDFLPGRSGSAPFKIEPITIKPNRNKIQTVFTDEQLQLRTVSVHHGPLPTLAWRVNFGTRSVTISGDTNGEYGTLQQLALRTDLLVAHHAIPENATGIARQLHMPPSTIAEIAKQADVKRVVLSHRMHRTLGKEDQTRMIMQQTYSGPIGFADDLDCYVIH